jgi:SAM-dependent methyltransferase
MLRLHAGGALGFDGPVPQSFETCVVALRLCPRTASPSADMGYHTFDPARADRLNDPERYRYCSRDELLAHLDPDPADRIVDFGSGTGFYTDDLAPFVSEVHAVDLQPELHRHYQARGVPTSVILITADVERLPLRGRVYDGAVSIMTLHEIGTVDTLVEIRSTLGADATLVICDWAASGDAEAGPPVEERFSLQEAIDLLTEANFSIDSTSLRPETFLVSARA